MIAPFDAHTPPGMVCDARWVRADVVEQAQLAHETFRLRLRCPDVARQIRPGQFFMVRPVDGTDPLLGRPFALYDTVDGNDGQPECIDFVYHVIGKMTGLMSGFSGGEQVQLWGPLGNGFPTPDARHLLYVGGGIGYTPVLATAREALGDRTYGDPPRQPLQVAEQVTLLYGVRSTKYRADLSDLERLGDRLHIRIATDDGSEGHHGLVTDLLQVSLAGAAEETGFPIVGENRVSKGNPVLSAVDRPDAVYCCGPVPMMHAVARICETANVPCWLSLESPMACGFGACFSCVTRVKTEDDPGWDYRRTCIEGPVFGAHELVIDP